MDIIEFCVSKGIKREYSNAKTPQQNRVAKRKNRILIEAARTMLADSFLPNTFWAEAVKTAYYVLNRILVTKPQNKTHYEFLTSKIQIISYIRPFGCHVTILNTIDHLGKFEENSNEGFLVSYSLNSKAFRLISKENKANKTAGPKEANNSAGTQDNIDAGNFELEAKHVQEYFILPSWSSYNSTVKSLEAKNGDQKLIGDTGSKTNKELVDQEDQAFLEELERLKRQAKEADDAAKTLRKTFAQVNTARTPVNTASTPVNTASIPFNPTSPSRNVRAGRPSYHEDTYVADFINLESTMNVSPIPQSRIHSIHPITKLLRYPNSVVQTRSKVNKRSGAYAFYAIFKSKDKIITWIFSTACLLAPWKRIQLKRDKSEQNLSKIGQKREA
uniref:Ribonuclease H-like domain-containing protein n=1 Tax=Tanacetum cinerariifolium TaxID=118510 RepID=A0A699JSW7_TANCI|nr:ribonuclease H-like domain-containing protein [Tanacetum cinerariifolium]